MNGLPPLGQLRHRASERFEHIRRARFWNDRLSIGLILTALVINVLNLLVLISKVHPSEMQGAVRYSSLDLGYTLGAWYYPYIVALLALFVTLVNATLGYQAFSRSRLASFCLLTGGVVIAIFAYIISNALGMAR